MLEKIEWGNQDRTIQRRRQRSAHKIQDKEKQSKNHGTESYKNEQQQNAGHHYTHIYTKAQ